MFHLLFSRQHDTVRVPVADDETLAPGTIVNLFEGRLVKAESGDEGLWFGLCQEAAQGDADGTVKAAVAVFHCPPVLRVATEQTLATGDLVDLAAEANGIATGENGDFLVTEAEEGFVRLIPHAGRLLFGAAVVEAEEPEEP